jgi:hypothetical protein
MVTVLRRMQPKRSCAPVVWTVCTAVACVADIRLLCRLLRTANHQLQRLLCATRHPRHPRQRAIVVVTVTAVIVTLNVVVQITRAAGAAATAAAVFWSPLAAQRAYLAVRLVPGAATLIRDICVFQPRLATASLISVAAVYLSFLVVVVVVVVGTA